MCGEAGEFANIVKKVERKSLDPKDPVVRKMLAMELTDVFIYVHCLAAVMGIDLGETYKQKRRENNTRFMKEREARDGQATVRR
jgi:NTP pyrophosphatase (non-canonical NTP hydrolase)